MPNRACRVSVTDVDGVEHTAQVTADTLFEAVARGLKIIRSSTWTADIPEGINTVTVRIDQPAVEHRVRMGTFRAWVNQNGGAPADKLARLKIREILGL